MSIELARNPLRIRTGQSRTEKIVLPAEADAVRAELLRCGVQEATVILWQVACIRCGRWIKDTFEFPDDDGLDAALLLELRVFSTESELHLRREGAQLIGRFRQDGVGEPAKYIDSIARIWGERTDDGAWMTLTDTPRKLSLTLPIITEASPHAGLVTRSYIGTHPETGQAGYIDIRYHSITAVDEKKGE